MLGCVKRPVVFPFLLAALLTATPARAAEEKETLQQQIAQRLVDVKDRKFITLNSENDLYGGGADQNYTNGARITYFDIGKRPPQIFDVIKSKKLFGWQKSATLAKN